MAEPVRFSPDEFDRIEDALEGLDGADALSDASPQVRDVLEAYRGILVASREALPLQDVPQGVLSAVFAEAHASAVAPPELAPTPQADPPPLSFWARLRRSFLVPTLALAGTAGLVLWLSRPQDGMDGMDRPEVAPATAAAKDASRADAQGTPATEQTQAEEAPNIDGEADKDEAPSPAAAPPPQTINGLRQQADEDVPAAAADSEAPGAVPQRLGKLGEAPEPEPKLPASKALAEPEAGAARWDLIERADRARQDGDCAAARSDYAIATEDDDAAVRSRAYAGLGLCNMQDGDDAGAEDAFERARGIDPAVGKYINAERSPSGNYSPSKPKPSSRKKSSAPSKSSKSSKSSSKSANSVDQASNPLSP